MAGVTHKKLTEVEAYTGPHAIEGIRFRHVRKELNVSAWGMNLLELEPHCAGYPEHDHVKDKQEEVYVVLHGAAFLRVDDKDYRVVQGEAIRVGPSHKRKWRTEGESVVLLALGGTPGKAYEPADM